MAKKVILNLSTVINGGAGSNALGNHKFLLNNGYDSYLVIKERNNLDHENVIQYPYKRFEKLFSKFKRILLRYLLNKSKFDEKYFFYNKFELFNCYSAKTILKMLPRKPDIIIVYWVSGFVNSKLIYDLANKTNATIYIFLVDNAPLTGGCHYPWDCEGYKNKCQFCPAISNCIIKNLAKSNIKYKQKYKINNAKIITGSTSDFLMVKESALFSSNSCFNLIDYIDDQIYKPAFSKMSIKKYFNIDDKKKIVFFGATFLNERRKGMSELLQALDLIKSRSNILLLIAGSADIGEISLDHKRVGFLSETDLIRAYQAADLFVCPSLEDSGPMMINQSIMCGTPVVAFNMGVSMDLVLTGETGYRAKYADVEDLAKGIDYILSLNQDEYNLMSNKCRILAMNSFSANVYRNNIHAILDDN